MTTLTAPRRIESFYSPDQLQTASPLRRLAGAVIDGTLSALPAIIALLIAAAVLVYLGQRYEWPPSDLMPSPLMPTDAQDAALLAALAPGMLAFLFVAVTLGLGWLIWFARTARNGQTPGKQLVGMYIMRKDGSRAGGRYVALRELVVKNMLFWGIVGLLTSGLGLLLAALWILWDEERQALWDKVGATYVAYSPNGFHPETAAEMRAHGRPITARGIDHPVPGDAAAPTRATAPSPRRIGE